MSVTVDDKSLFAALESRVKAIVGSTPVAWPNMKFEPAGDMYVKVDRMPADSRTPSFGGDHVRDTGILLLTVLIPAGTGSGAGDAMASSLRNGFRAGSTYTKNSVTVLITGAPSRKPAVTQSAWYGLPVAVPYRADYLG